MEIKAIVVHDLAAKLRFGEKIRMYNPFVKWIGPKTEGLWPISQRWAGKKMVFLSNQLFYVTDLKALKPVVSVVRRGAVGLPTIDKYECTQPDEARVAGQEMRGLEIALKRYFSGLRTTPDQVFRIEFSNDPAEVRDFFRYMIRLEQRATTTNQVTICGCTIRLVDKSEMQEADTRLRISVPK